MVAYRIGSKGPEVLRIQKRLQMLGFYRGPLDADFGGGTESAVRAFQKSQHLEIDGVVGPDTWRGLFPRQALPELELLGQPLDQRCLALTGTFETAAPVPDCYAGLSGDFDGQGLSFGALQWNLGQGSLQPLLREMDRAHRRVFDEVFNQNAPVLRAMLEAGREEQLDWARSIQDPRRFRLFEPWHGQFKTLGRREEFQKIQLKAAKGIYATAQTLCAPYEVSSQRAVALMFDITVQNGSIGPLVKAQIQRDFATLSVTGAPEELEVARLRIIANRRAEAAKPQWVEDVRIRKLAIADGEGTVHGIHVHLEQQFGIGLQPAVSSSPRGAVAGSGG